MNRIIRCWSDRSDVSDTNAKIPLLLSTNDLSTEGTEKHGRENGVFFVSSVFSVDPLFFIRVCLRGSTQEGCGGPEFAILVETRYQAHRQRNKYGEIPIFGL